MSIIEGAVYTSRILVDGTLALTVHVEPRNRKAALELFADPGTAVALAALDRMPPDEPVDEPVKESKPVAKPPVGRWALWTVQRCREDTFQEWIRPIYDRAMGGSGSRYGDLSPTDVRAMGVEGFARHAVLVLLDIESRREIDEPGVIERFHEIIRRPYQMTLIGACEAEE